MEKLIEKISSYNLFTSLVPGMIFIMLSDYLNGTNFYTNDYLYLLFEAYFIGVIISRISSVIIENILYKIFSIKKEPYDKYILAVTNDEQIPRILQECNMYRNLFTTIILVLIITIIKKIFDIDFTIVITILIILSILFALSFIKQSKYLIARVKTYKKQK